MRCGLLIVFFSLWIGGRAQTGYQTGEVVEDFKIPKVLNFASSTVSFNTVKQKLTIIDFFGTWCVPCIKALPHLTQLQQQYAKEVRILLVSNEKEAKLKSFISSHKLLLPLVVDEVNEITGMFQPPSYPYTVVLDANGKVLAATEASAITDAAIQNWLTHKAADDTVILKEAKKEAISVTYNREKSLNKTVQLSQELVYAAKTGDATNYIEKQLQQLNGTTLQEALTNDNERKAFWINLYNAYTQILLKKDPQAYKQRNRFFTKKQILVGGYNFSLDAIEHDILRRSKTKWSLGYINKLFPSKKEKELRVDNVDYRIHFALNCGAKSCPPIAYYTPEGLDEQLTLAAQNYLNNEVTYDAQKNRVYLPAIMSWFRADFGGKKGMQKLLKKYIMIPTGANPKIKFKDYDWTLQLNNYKSE